MTSMHCCIGSVYTAQSRGVDSKGMGNIRKVLILLLILLYLLLGLAQKTAAACFQKKVVCKTTLVEIVSAQIF